MVSVVTNSFTRTESGQTKPNQTMRFGELGSKGFTINQISREMGIDAHQVARHFQSLGKAAKGRGGTESHAIAMASQGFHSSVIAVTLGVQEKYVSGILRVARAENRIPVATTNIVHGVANRLRIEHSSAKQPIGKGNDPVAVVEKPIDKDDEVPAGISQTEAIRELSAQGKTAGEIADAIGTSPMKVINEANKNSIYFYVNDDERNDVESILDLKTEGMTVDEVCEEIGIKKSVLSARAKSVVERKGPHHEIFRRLLDEGLLVTSVLGTGDTVTEISPPVSVTNEASADSSAEFYTGQMVAIRSDISELRPDVAEHAGRRGVVASFLSGVVLIHLEGDTTRSLLVFPSELRPMRGEDSWTIDEIVTFTTPEGGEIVGKIAAGPYTSKGVIKYVVIDDEENDMLVAGNLFDQ